MAGGLLVGLVRLHAVLGHRLYFSLLLLLGDDALVLLILKHPLIARSPGENAERGC